MTVRSAVVVQIESETYPGRFCYIECTDGIWSRHTNIATAFRNRAAAILTIEKIRVELSKLNSPTTESLINRLRNAKLIPVDLVSEDICVIDRNENS